MGACAHWRAPVQVAGGTVLCSGWLARPDLCELTVSRAVYLDSAWLEATILPRSAVTIVEWPDFGVIEPTRLASVADSLIAALRGGPVDIGCLGGHGRTGTLLATLIGVAESLPADQAIRAARERYCTHAVETPAQAALVAAALACAAATST